MYEVVMVGLVDGLEQTLDLSEGPASHGQHKGHPGHCLVTAKVVRVDVLIGVVSPTLQHTRYTLSCHCRSVKF